MELNGFYDDVINETDLFNILNNDYNVTLKEEKISEKAGYSLQGDKGNEMDSKEKNVLFASFDICSSSELKIRFKNNWVDMIEILLSNKMTNMSFWKFNGDEVLYCREVHSLPLVIELIHKISKQVEVLQTEMKDRFKETIFIKATVWIARVSFGKENDFRNGFQKICNYEFFKDELCDYVGINMDEGFRLCRHASPRKVVLDPKLVFILLKSYLNDFYNDVKKISTYKKDVLEIIDNIYFYKFVNCKGVWKERNYPTYWYIEDNLEDVVHYDEVEDIDEFRSISELDIEKDKENNIKKAYRFLERIFKNVEAYNEIKILVESFRKYKAEDTQKRTETVANLYYMVTCINPLTGNVLLAKRSASRMHLKGVWDFGNVKFQKVDIPSYIADEYKKTFGIDISLDVDKTRGGNIVPYGCCKVYRNCNPHNGILCHAIIDSPSGTDEELTDIINSFIQDNNQYSEVVFIDQEKAKIFSENELSIEEIRDDSEFASRGINNKNNTDGKCLMYICNSIESAQKYYQEYKLEHKKDE